MILPDFIVLGAHRAGTTYLHDNLDTHPDICLCRKKKELHYFDRDANYVQGPEYYSGLFDKAEGRQVGDITPNYLAAEGVAERIHHTVPNAKLVVSLRDPVERAFSHYRLRLSNSSSANDWSFEETIEKRWDEIVGQGMYSRHLATYYELIPPENIFVIIFERFMGDPEKHFRHLYEFLGVCREHKSPWMNQKINANASRRRNSRSLLLYKLSLQLRKRGLNRLKYFIDRHNQAPGSLMKEGTRKSLQVEFAGEVDELRALLKDDLGEWSWSRTKQGDTTG